MKKSTIPILKRIIFCVVFILLFSLRSIVWSESSDYWPNQGWRISSPEEQGISSEDLADMISIIMYAPNSIDSVTVIRNGYIVLDAYFYPFQKNSAHIIHSCTKSITSTLIGIAIDKGYIKDVHHGLLDFFPEMPPGNMTEEKKGITLENVLTMATGLECRDSYKYKWQGLRNMRKSNNWTQYMLDLPMEEAPGQRFEYCNGATYLLSAIIQKRTGMRSLKFAKDNLFEPLGISEVKWELNPHGIDVGYGRMWLKPHDMAKFGWLFLKNGKWNGKTIVSEEWVKAATRGYVEATLYDQYGYQWWIDNEGYYVAVGYAGQRIFVVPKFDMVVVFTSHQSFTKPDMLMKDYIIKSVKSDMPLSSNTPAHTRLNHLVDKCRIPPEPSAIKELPPISQRISGVRYNIESNFIGFMNFTLNFGLKKNVAIMEYGINERQNTVEVGLDGVYRITELTEGKVAFKGRWLNENTFKFSYINVGHTEGSRGEINFIENRVDISVTGPYGGRLSLKGTRE
jgi:CubicO group peptidase (beta-lactamase class C family)